MPLGTPFNELNTKPDAGSQLIQNKIPHQYTIAMEQNVMQPTESSNQAVKKSESCSGTSNVRDNDLVKLVLVPISELKSLAAQFKRTKDVYSRVHVSLRENDRKRSEKILERKR